MLGLDDLEALLGPTPKGDAPSRLHEDFQSFEEFCDESERLIAAGSLTDDQLSDAYDAWERGDAPETFAERHLSV